MPPDYLPHQQRVLDEQRELQKKLEALTRFIDTRDGVFDSLSAVDRGHLHQQAFIMAAYVGILATRIAAFA